MSVTIKTLACNNSCQSCYENRIRRNWNKKYQITKIKKSLCELLKHDPDNKWNSPTLHGGEPLLLKIEHIEELFKIIYKKYKRTGIQTNLELLTPQHIELFKKYNTHIGVSLDGFELDMNQGRTNDPILVRKNMDKLKENNIKMSVILVLRRYNSGCVMTLNILHNFIRILNEKYNIWDIRTNPGIVFEPELINKEQLANEQLKLTFETLANMTFQNPKLNIQPIRDITELLMGYRFATCIFRECDPYCTNSETPIFENGMVGNCLKSGGAIDGIITLRQNTPQFERYKMLKQVPQENNGCKSCRYWNLCLGGCPGEALDNDWRNRTRFCEAWYFLFNLVERKIKGIFPNIYLAPNIGMNSSGVLSSISGSTWRQSERRNLEELKQKCTDNKNVFDNRGHGDRPHGDKHGDHTDKELIK